MERRPLISPTKPSNYRSLLASFLASLMSFSSGTVIAGWSSVGKEGIDKDSVTWSTEQESWIISVYVIGALIAALPAGSLSQKYGRKTFLLWLALPMTVGWIICLLGTKILWLECLGRFACGLSLGATTVAVPLYASDVSPDVLRGRTGVFLDFMLCAGIQFAYVARTVLTSMRQFCAVCALVPLTFVALFSCMPESPVHLFDAGRHEEAAAELRWLRGNEFNVENYFKRLEISQWSEMSMLESNRKIYKENKRYLIKVWIVSLGLVFIQRLSGAGGVIQYSVVLFKLSGTTIEPNVACIVLGMFQLAASGGAFLLVDKVGRRTLLLISSSVVTTCLMILVVYFALFENTGTTSGCWWKTTLLIVLCVFISAFRLGLGPVPWFISTELVTGGRVQSVAACFSWSLSFAIMKSFEMLVEEHPVALWSTFATCSAAGLLFVALVVPETNNKSREQIRLDMSGD